MSGFLSSKASLAVAVQADSVTRATIATPADLMPFANLRSNPETFTLANPEVTGSVHRPGDAVLGRAANDAFDIVMRGPGGASPPAANAYVPGRIIRAAGFQEIIFAGLASEALGGASSNAGATTTVILGVGASAVDDFYVGYTIQFASIGGGSGVDSTSQIVDYNGTTKVATLGEKLAALPTGNYSIPPQLIYRLQGDFTPLYLTFDKWLDQKRYFQQNGIPAQLQWNFPTSNRGDTNIPLMSVGLQGDIDEAQAEADEAAPLVAAGGAIAPFRDGKLFLNGVALGGASVAYEHGIQVAFPPNPNKPTGNDAGCITETRRSVSLNLNEVLLATFNANALAAAQTEIALMLQYGNVAGRTVYFCVPSGRLGFGAADASGQFVTTNPTLFIDGAEKAVAVSFPYFT